VPGHLQPLLDEPWVLDVDATIKPLYGHQEGAVVGYNPRKPGRLSHCYHTYMLSDLRVVLRVEVHPAINTIPSTQPPGCGRCWRSVRRIGYSCRYEPLPTGLRAMTALLVLRNKAIKPLLAAAQPLHPARAAHTQNRSTPITKQLPRWAVEHLSRRDQACATDFRFLELVEQQIPKPASPR
jgi:hypothetical protein